MSVDPRRCAGRVRRDRLADQRGDLVGRPSGLGAQLGDREQGLHVLRILCQRRPRIASWRPPASFRRDPVARGSRPPGNRPGRARARARSFVARRRCRAWRAEHGTAQIVRQRLVRLLLFEGRDRRQRRVELALPDVGRDQRQVRPDSRVGGRDGLQLAEIRDRCRPSPRWDSASAVRLFDVLGIERGCLLEIARGLAACRRSARTPRRRAPARPSRPRACASSGFSASSAFPPCAVAQVGVDQQSARQALASARAAAPWRALVSAWA